MVIVIASSRKRSSRPVWILGGDTKGKEAMRRRSLMWTMRRRLMRQRYRRRWRG
jgi:hypothetical protein